jgi:protein O-mannosyl-transferase
MSHNPSVRSLMTPEWRRWLGVAVIVLAGVIAFGPAMHGDWVWDDDSEIVNNAVIKDPAGLRKIWAGAGTLDYFPLKTSVQWVQWRLFGPAPFGYHVTNLVLHLLSALLIWRLLRRLGVKYGWVGGLLFAVHPLTVESVAWIAELKNALSLPPLLLAFDRYIAFAEKGRRRDHLLALLLFAAAMLCKTSVVMLPVFLLVYAWWRRGRIAREDVVATVPFFAVSLLLGAVTVWFQHTRAIGEWEIAGGGMLERIGRAGAALVFYLWKSVVPVGLLPIYPRGVPPASGVLQGIAWVAIVAVLYWAWRYRAGRGRHVLLGGAWFVLHLAPVLGLIDMSYMHIAWVADHFVYISLVAVVGLAAAAGDMAWRSSLAVRGGLSAAALFLVGFGIVETRRGASHFTSEATLWQYTLQRNPEAWLGHNNLAVALAREKRFAESFHHASEALRLLPSYADAHATRALALVHLGRLDEALTAVAQAKLAEPRAAELRLDIAAGLLRAGRLAEALDQYGTALQLNPHSPRAHKEAGVALFLAGRTAEAVYYYEHGLQAAPDAATHTNCGVALVALGKFDEAIRHYEQALKLSPNHLDAHYNYGIALARAGRPVEAKARFAETVRLQPDHAEAHYHLGELFLQLGRDADARHAFAQALRFRPELVDARRQLERLESSASKP